MTPTRTVCRASSELKLNAAVVDSASDRLQNDETPNKQESQARDSTPTEWTDEKHSLYLKSIEASFVDELYDSFDLLGWHSREECTPGSKSSREMHAHTRILSGQYKVLRNGCWTKINFAREKHNLERVGGSGVLLANPWIQHFRSGCEHLQREAEFGSPSNMSHSHLCVEDSLESGAEAMDQNFATEDTEEKNSSKNCSIKRMKT